MSLRTNSSAVVVVCNQVAEFFFQTNSMGGQLVFVCFILCLVWLCVPFQFFSLTIQHH